MIPIALLKRFDRQSVDGEEPVAVALSPRQKDQPEPQALDLQ